MISLTTVTREWHILNLQIEETDKKKARELGRGLIPPHHVTQICQTLQNVAQRRFKVTQILARVCCPYDL